MARKKRRLTPRGANRYEIPTIRKMTALPSPGERRFRVAALMSAWILTAWLCVNASGECRPVTVAYPDRGACLRAERIIKRSGNDHWVAPHCHRVRPESGV
jgi:hypothetical protein